MENIKKENKRHQFTQLSRNRNNNSFVLHKTPLSYKSVKTVLFRGLSGYAPRYYLPKKIKTGKFIGIRQNWELRGRRVKE